jgi:hypothetical protein
MYEKRIAMLTGKVQAAERLVKIKNENIRELIEMQNGKDEIISILSAYMCEAIDRKGTIEIDSSEIQKGLSIGYDVYNKDGIIVINKKCS